MSNNRLQSIDPIINKIINQSYNSDYKHKPKSNTKTNKFYDQFKPLDQILIKPIIDNSYIIMRELGYKSQIVGFISLLSFCIGLYFVYNRKNNLTWIFIFMSFFVSFFDKLYSDELDNKTKSREMLIIIIKLTIYVLLNMILNLYIFNKSDCKIIKNYIYLLVIILIIIKILIHHTEKIFIKEKIKSRKFLFLKRINNFIILICIIFIFYLSLNIRLDKTADNNLFNLFIKDDK